MAGKKKVEKEGSSWVGEVEKYSRQIWLAGLGAYSKISNDGSKLFETLVKDGEKAEKQAKTRVDEQVDAAKSSAKSAKSRVGDVKERALGKWSELEEAFDKRLNSAISRLGVPSRNEVKALHQQVDTLTKQIEKLTGASVKSVSAKPAAAKPAAAAKPLAKAAPKAAAKPATKTAAAKPAAKPAAAKAAARPAAAKPPVARKPAVKKAPAAKPATAVNAAPAATPAASAAPAPVSGTPSVTPAPTSQA
ncbi:phasin family protein [Pseudomonas defluvii]|uniref:phasin family protein n=1 Tax=Pseudomonas defluvii TaxID=1876757 RepID=UPI0039058D05